MLKEETQQSENFFNEPTVWMTCKEAAHYLRRSEAQLRNMVYRKQVKAKKFANRLYFNRRELYDAINNSRY